MDILAVFINLQDYARRTKTAVMRCPSATGVEVNHALEYRRLIFFLFFGVVVMVMVVVMVVRVVLLTRFLCAKGIESCCVQQVSCAQYTGSFCLNTDKDKCAGGKWIEFVFVFVSLSLSLLDSFSCPFRLRHAFKAAKIIDDLYSGVCPGEAADNIKCCVITAAAEPAAEPNQFSTSPNPLETPDSQKLDTSAMTGNKDLKIAALGPNSVGTLDLANPFVGEIPGSGTNPFVVPNSAAVPNYDSVQLAEGITDLNPQLPIWQDFFQGRR